MSQPTTTITIKVYGTGFTLQVPGFKNQPSPTCYPQSLDEAGTVYPIKAFKTAAPAARLRHYEQAFAEDQKVENVRYEVRETEVDGQTYHLVVAVLATQPTTHEIVLDIDECTETGQPMYRAYCTDECGWQGEAWIHADEYETVDAAARAHADALAEGTEHLQNVGA